MDKKNKFCSSFKHKENDAISFCEDCKIYMCNKCDNYHVENFHNHHKIKYSKESDSTEIFTGLCNENNHLSELI